MKFGFIAKHRGIWPSTWLCETLDISRSGFYAWLTRDPSNRQRSNEPLIRGVLKLHATGGISSLRGLNYRE